MNDYTFSSTSNTITLTWTEPDLIPSYGYAATRYCRRLCEKSVIDNLECTSSPPLVISGINPGSTCTISSLIGLYGVIGFALANGDVITTLSVGEL